MNAADRAYRRFRETGDPAALAELYDRTADRLLRAASHLAPCLAAAEDLVQATFVVAIEKAPDFDPSRPVTPWLVGILGKQAQLSRWRRGREDLRADLEPAPRDGEGPADRASRAELLKAVEAALEQLPETYRPVLLLRLLHGLEPTAIAHSLGRPAGTVRSQLARGLQLLRSRVPAGFASGLAVLGTPPRGLEALRESVVQAAVGTQAAATATLIAGGGTTLFGTLAMKKTLASLAAVALLAIAGSTLWHGEAGPDPVIAATDAPRAARHETEDAPVESSGQRDAIPDTSPTPPTARLSPAEADSPLRCALEVQVLWEEDRQPAAGVTVLANLFGNVGWTGRQVAVTDEQGRTRLRFSRPRPLTIQTVRGGEVRPQLTPGEDNRAELLVPRGVRVRGRVVDPDGVPLAGAAVWLSEPWRDDRGQVVARSDATGHFTLHHVGGDRNLAVHRADFTPSRIYPIKGDPGATRDLEIVLSPGGGRLRGQVLDPVGEPVAGAYVLVGEEGRPYDHRHEDGSWVTGAPPRMLRSDAEGSFAAVGLECGTVTVQVRADGHPPWRGSVEITPYREGELVARLQQPAAVHGVVRQADGSPAPFAQLHVGPVNRFASEITHTGVDGAFRLNLLTAGTLQLRATHDAGKAETTLELQAGEVAQWSPTLESVEPDVPVLRGQLVDAQGRPLPYWRAVVSTRDTPRETRAVLADAQGRFELNVPWDRFRFVAHGRHGWKDFPPLLRDDLIADGIEQRLEVPDPELANGKIRARVIDRQGQPIGAQFQLWHEDLGLWREFTNSSETGQMLIPTIAPGRVHVKVRPADHAWMELEPVQVRAGSTHDLGDLVATGGSALRGTLRMGDGTELPEALRVDLYGSDGQQAAVIQRNGGSFRGGPVLPGSYRLVVQGPGVRSLRIPITVTGGPWSRDLVLEAAARRQLRFVLPQGMARPRHVTVLVRRPDGELEWNGGLGPSGPLELDISVPPGRYELAAHGPDGPLHNGPLVVESYAKAPPLEILLRAPR